MLLVKNVIEGHKASNILIGNNMPQWEHQSC